MSDAADDEAGAPPPGERIRLPGGEVEIPRLGVGTWAWGDSTTWGMGGYDRSYGLESIAEAFAASIELGAGFFDTAEAYGDGESERILGRLLGRPLEERSGPRPVIATKFLPWPKKVRVRAELLRSLRASLDRLGLPSVDLYQVHGPISLRSHRAMADALAAARDAGWVRAVGVSNYSARQVRAIHAALARHGVPLATNQVELSLLRTRPIDTGLLETCRSLGVTVLAYSPLGQGRLTGKYDRDRPPPGGRTFSPYPMAELEGLLAELVRIGRSRAGTPVGERTPAQVALAWIVAKGAVPIPGAKNGAQARQNAGALGWTLTDEEVAALDRLSKPGLRSLEHRIWQRG